MATTTKMGWWEARQNEYHARLAANEAAIKRRLKALRFSRSKETYTDSVCYDLGSLRVAFITDDERLELYGFDGVVGSAPLEYQVSFGLSMPVAIVLAAIEEAVADQKNRQ